MGRIVVTTIAVHVAFIFGALLNFLPQAFGYHLKFLNGSALSGGALYNSTIVSLTVALLLILESLWSRIFNFLFPIETGTKYFKSPCCILFLIAFADLLLLSYSFPTNLDTIPGIFLLCDTLYSWSFLFSLSNVDNKTWTFKKSILIGILVTTLNWIRAWMAMSNVDLYVVSVVLATVIIVLLGYLSSRTLFRVLDIGNQNLDITKYFELIQASIYVIFFNLYTIGKLSMMYGRHQNESSNWIDLNGTSYLTMMTYLMAICVASVVLLTNGISKSAVLKLTMVSRISLILYTQYICNIIIYLLIQFITIHFIATVRYA